MPSPFDPTMQAAQTPPGMPPAQGGPDASTKQDEMLNRMQVLSGMKGELVPQNRKFATQLIMQAATMFLQAAQNDPSLAGPIGKLVPLIAELMDSALPAGPSFELTGDQFLGTNLPRTPTGEPPSMPPIPGMMGM